MQVQGVAVYIGAWAGVLGAWVGCPRHKGKAWRPPLLGGECHIVGVGRLARV